MWEKDEVVTRKEGKRYILEVGLLCNWVALFNLFVAFVSGYWIISWPRVYSPFKRIGLWEACFAGLVLETDEEQRAYHGCWWILASHFWRIRGWLMPGWFIFTQVALTLCFVAEIVGTAMWTLVWLITGGRQRDRKKKQRDPIFLIQTGTVITVTTAFFVSASILIFGISFRFDYGWLPNPYFNYLSWSYGLAIVSAFFSIFAGICQVVYSTIARREMKLPPSVQTFSMAPTYTDTQSSKQHLPGDASFTH